MLAHPDTLTKRLLGAYYTPAELSDILAKFALRSPEDTVLEPSFGGGAFLRSAVDRLSELGAPRPEKQIFGCDIDTHAFDHLPSYFGRRMGKVGRRFILRDFLDVDSQSFMEKKFDCILANPPFIGYAKLTNAQRDHAKNILNQFNIKNNRYASLWYYFILNSLLVLKEGGRIIFVLPHAFIDNDYALSLRTYLTRNFNTVATFSLPNRIFNDQGTKERVVVLVAQGWQETSTNNFSNAIHVNNFDELDEYLTSLKDQRVIKRRHLKCAVGRVSGALTSTEASLVNEVVNSAYAKRFGEFVDVKIGLVTGDAKYFTFNKEKISQYGLSPKRHFLPLMRSLKENLGVDFTSNDFKAHVASGREYYLLKYEDGMLSDERYLDYLNTYDLSKIDSNQTFMKRENWCEVDDGLVSDLFLAYMSISYPRAVINDAQASCINSTHRGFFKNNFPNYFKKLICLSLLTGFTRVFAEMEAKVYGNKMLKMEPGFYTKLKILIPDNVVAREVNSCFSQVNQMLRKGESDEASKLASQFIYSRCFSSSEEKIYEENFEKIRLKLQERRKSSS